MYKKMEIGKLGEDISAEYLSNKGYEIIERNFECKQGEIDIIAKDKDYLVFIEVKTRTNNLYGNPRDAVDTVKKKHIYKSAEFYNYCKHIQNKPIRIDVIEVYINKEKYTINHIKNAIMDREN